MTSLDKARPYGVVVGGQTGAAYHQDGNLFRADGSPVGAPAPAPAPTPAPVAAEPAPEPAPEPADDRETREQLQALHPSKIKAIMEKQGLTPVSGSGSKAKNIEILLAHDSG